MKSNLQSKLWTKQSFDLHMSSSVGRFNQTSAFLVLYFFVLNNGKTPFFLNQDYCFKLKCTFYLSVNVFSSKVLIESTIVMSPTGRELHFTCMWSSEPCKDLAICRAKEVPSFLSYFKTLSVGLLLEIKPTTSHSAVKFCTDWANPAHKCLHFRLTSQWLCMYLNLRCNCSGETECTMVRCCWVRVSQRSLKRSCYSANQIPSLVYR